MSVARSKEISLLLNAIHTYYGYDLSGYSQSFIKRRLYSYLRDEKIKLPELIVKIIQDSDFFYEFFQNFSIQFTEMFRDPSVFKMIRETIMRELTSYAVLNVWHVGCASGEEAYSLAILLHEVGLLDKSTIYATDINHVALKKAMKGAVSLEKLRAYSKNYALAGGTDILMNYFDQKGSEWIIKDFIKKRITFAYHNILSDGGFCETNLVFCRNVLIYFNDSFQKKALQTIFQSIGYLGYLILGDREMLNSEDKEIFKPLCPTNKIYRKVK